MAAAGPGGWNPVTPQGSVVVNGQFDRTSYLRRRQGASGVGDTVVYPDVGDGHVFSIAKGELCFQFMQFGTKILHQSMVNNPDLAVSSSLNGLVMNSQNRDVTSNQVKKCMEGYATPHENMVVQRAVRQTLRFVGVNQTMYDPDAGGNRSNAVSITVAGSVTITNTGANKIEIGHQVCWDIPGFGVDANAMPHPAQTGQPQSKARLVTVPYGVALKQSKQLVVREIGGDSSLRNVFQGSAQDADIENILDILDDRYTADARSRIIGTALSKAAPGQPFDMLLRYSH